jgi:MFS family permease
MASSSLFRNRSFIALLVSRFVASLATQIQAVAVGWHVYDLSNDPVALGYVGLAVFIPMALTTLPAGDMVDRFNRRTMIALGGLLQCLTATALLALTIGGVTDLWPYYAAVTFMGVARAVGGPAYQAMVPQVVGDANLGRAVALVTSCFQTATIAGPAIGGVIYLFGPQITFALCIGLFALGVCAVMIMRGPFSRPRNPSTLSAWGRLCEGISYVRHNPVVLGAQSLDMMAVLLGGATALLPVYARDILHVGPDGLGLLRAAPAVGAVMVGLALGRWPLGRHVGRWLFSCVALFGAATVVFGLSTSFTLSLISLLVMGAADMISMYVRLTLVQLATPDAMRGRVSSVNVLFIGASNELGEFESGVTAGWFGAVPAVIIGGVGTLAVVGLWAWMFPALRRVDRMSDVTPVPPDTAGEAVNSVR